MIEKSKMLISMDTPFKRETPTRKSSRSNKQSKLETPVAQPLEQQFANGERGPRKKNGKRSNSGQLLLDATSKVLSERNTMDISLSEIAAASGLNSALISYHFGNKEGLLLALIRRDTEIALVQLAQLLKMNLSPEQKIRQHIYGIIHTYAKFPYLNRLIHILLDSSIQEITRELGRFFVVPVVDAHTKIIDEGVAAGVFRRVDLMCFYFTFVGACDIIFYGRASLENVFGIRELTPQLLDTYAEFVADTALRMLRPD